MGRVSAQTTCRLIHDKTFHPNRTEDSNRETHETRGRKTRITRISGKASTDFNKTELIALLNHTAAQTIFSIVKHDGLSGGDPLVRLGQRHFPATVLERAEPAIGEARAMPNLGLEVQALRAACDPIDLACSELRSRVIEV